MNHEAHTHDGAGSLSVLLPTAAVAVYANDQKTLESARNLEKDWRFARVALYVEQGDVETAIETLKNAVSPDLVIIQTDTIDPAFTARLEELAGCCDEGTSAIVIGPDNDVNLYRRLIDMGVSDYLVRPVETADFAAVIAKSLIEKIGATGSRLVVYAGAKGGVGTSLLAQASACISADILGQKTILLDGAGGWSSLSVGLGFEPGATLAQAIRAADSHDEDGFKRMIFKAGEKLHVLATGGGAMLDAPVIAAQFEALIDRLMTSYPVVMIDVSQAPEGLQRVALSRAHHNIVVTTPTLPALRLARALMTEIKDMRGGSGAGLDLLVNMQGFAGALEVSKSDLEQAMECKPALSLPFEPKIFMGNENESRKLTEDKAARTLLEKTLVPLLVEILHVSVKEEQGRSAPDKTSLWGNFFKKKA